MGMQENLEAMLAGGEDNALLRFTLGSLLFRQGDVRRAAGHLREAVRQDPEYSAAWKILGKALQALDDIGGACQAYERGIETAERTGDMQAAREMRVFLQRAQGRDWQSRQASLIDLPERQATAAASRL